MASPMVQLPLPSTLVQSLTGHTAAVHTVAYSRDGAYCLTGSADRTVKLWNPSTGMCIKTYATHGKDVLGIALPLSTTDNNRFASCGMDRAVILWDVGTGRPLRRWDDHKQRVNAVSFNADASVIASGSYDTTVRIWDCRAKNAWKPVQVLDGSKDSVEAVQILGHEILVGCVDGFIKVYDVRAGKVTTDSIGHPVTSARFSNDGNCILSSTLDNVIRLFDKETGELLSEYIGHKNSDYRIVSTFSYTDAHVVSGSEDGRICMWDLVESTLVRTLDAHSKAVTCVAYHPKSHVMVSTSLDSTVKVWEM
ncbi:hypothetical protein BASA50_003484 [Batrachochytrium salamandrivorans]|uniref:Uncharacterized protein n=1 Tax=Batrachochytrium salamandrivorans TaxID=1357716 RepID=A0ABQ8FHK2_9FUNG|nr:hypothetical protein BASA62_003861 [Batrachochytrium salamandrivorans]KAH6575308.1 hypothetical protein BASA60_005112 [Batrachochytrium salamandrivorans]KAH6598443.1 hypothetical protein BASA50_003484 [Batrachochytrium salamandrivorans]KAH6599153.1 hypothetical protein BASA61_002684 [Batrachochytrium salamandrivorans]KAH9266866.1 hypothetical protein BASA84_000928 [Batrachochytrium salamandrivorans]